MSDVLPFLSTFALHLTDGEREVITRPIVGDGGHQRLLSDCLQRLRGNALTLDVLTIDHVQRYAYDYGSGGYQERFRILVSAARRAGWQAAAA